LSNNNNGIYNKLKNAKFKLEKSSAIVCTY